MHIFVCVFKRTITKILLMRWYELANQWFVYLFLHIYILLSNSYFTFLFFGFRNPNSSKILFDFDKTLNSLRPIVFNCKTSPLVTHICSISWTNKIQSLGLRKFQSKSMRICRAICCPKKSVVLNYITILHSHFLRLCDDSPLFVFSVPVRFLLRSVRTDLLLCI